MADARENQEEDQRRRRSNETESRSIEETKGRNPDLGMSESDERTYRRQEMYRRSWTEKRENEDGLRINESGQNRDHRDSYSEIRDYLQQQGLRDSEMQGRRSHETESRFLPPKKRATNLGRGSVLNPPRFKSYHSKNRVAAQPMRQDRTSDWRASECSQRFDERRHERQSSSTPENRGPRRHETESLSTPEKREKTIPYSKDRDPRQRFRDISQRHHENDWVFKLEKKYNKSLSQISDEIVAGILRDRMEKELVLGARNNLQEQRQRGNVEWQRIEAQENELEEGEIQDNLHEQRQREKNIGWRKRDAQENVQEQMQRDTEMQRREDEESLEEQILQAKATPASQVKEICDEKDSVFNLEKRFNKSLRQITDEIVAGIMRERMEKEQGQFQGNGQDQRQRGNIEWQRREAQDHVEEQIQRDIEMQRREVEENVEEKHAHDQPDQ